MFSRTPQYITHQLSHLFKCRAVTVLLVVLATLLGMAAPLVNAAQTTVYGPKTASIAPKKGKSTDVFSNVDTYSPGRNIQGPFTLIVENQSPDMKPGDKHARKSLKVEIWHNSKRIATDSDFFNSNGKAIPGFQKPIELRDFSNLVMVKVIGKIPVSFTYKVVAGKTDTSPALVTALWPNPLGLTNGTSGLLNATLNPAPVAAGSLALSSSNPGAATVPETVPFTAGQVTVAIPVQTIGIGQSTITAQLNGSRSSANVNVSPAPAKVISLLPTQSTLQQGAPGQLQVAIAPSQLQETVVTLVSSDPAKVSVPVTVAIPAGQTSVGFTAQGVAVGNAQVTASLNNSAGVSNAAAQVQVVPLPPTVVSLLPATNVLQKGSTAQLVVKLSASQSTDTIVALQARTSGVVELPSSVVVQAGASQISFPVRATEVGNTLVAASLNGSTVESAVQVTPVPAAVAALAPATSNVVVGGTTQLTLKLNNAQSTVTTVALAADPSGIVQVPGTVQVPVGQTEVVFSATALAVGQADVVATLNGSTQRAKVVVSPVPAAIAEILPNPFGLQQGASGNLTIRLNNAQSAPVTVALAAADPNLLRVPESVVIPAGQVSQTAAVQALQAGSTQLVATLNGASQSVVVNITVPPPQIATLEPASQDLPKGKLGKLLIQLDRSPLAPVLVSIGNSNSAVLGLPAQITIPAGQMGIEIPMTALSLGQATVSVTLNGSTKNVLVTVVEPEIVGIVITPDTLMVTPGQSTQVQATGTYSDGSTKEITTGQGTVWSTASETIATVTPEGRLTGVAQGQTVLSARQTVQPTYGNPTPSDIVAQAAVTVGSPAPLAISAAKTALLAGETVVVSITAPYAAGATAYTVNLASNGTAALQHPATVSINPGLVSVNVNVTATTAGTVQLTATAQQFASGQIDFTVTNLVSSKVAITSLAPTTGAVGSIVTINGSGFTTPANTNAVTFADNSPAVVQSGSATQLLVRVPDAAQTGPITVNNANGLARSDTFTVLREQDFSFQISPSSVDVIQGSSASVVLNLASVGTNNFEGLAKLTANGLPQGVTATFDPPSLSAFQTGKLTLQADSSAALAVATVNVRAEATLNGLPWVRQSNVAVRIVNKTGVTGVKGRFITPEGRGVAGVIVRQDTTTNQVLTDAAGNFTLTGLASGVTTLRFDATPANPLYPIWPMNVSLEAGELRTYEDWIINPPPTDEKFVAIGNATQEQRITDQRFPGFEVVLPAGATITGWDGVRKTRIAVERILPDQLPVEQPPFVMKEAYQLYFGTPMGGIPSEPIPVTLPNVAERDPGDEVPIWWFDGSPMGGTGEWKLAGMGTVSDDGKSVVSNPGVGLPRFCGVCGLVSLSCDPPPEPPEPPPVCDPPQSGKPIDLYTGQEMMQTPGMSCSGKNPVGIGWRYNPVDSFQNRAFTRGSFGMGWTNAYDVVFLPFAGAQKRMVMPGGRRVNFTGSTGDLRTTHPLFEGAVARKIGDDSGAVGSSVSSASIVVPLLSRSASSSGGSGSGGGGGSSVFVSLDPRPSVQGGSTWEVLFKDGTRWLFEPYSGFTSTTSTQFQRGGPPSWLTRVIDRNGNVTRIGRNSTGKIINVDAGEGRRFNMTIDAEDHVSSITDHTGRTTQLEYTEEHRISRMTDPEGRVTRYEYQPLPIYTGPRDITTYSGASRPASFSSSTGGGGGGGSVAVIPVSKPLVACGDHIPWLKTPAAGLVQIDPPPRSYPVFSGLREIHEPGFLQPTVNTYSTDRVLRQVTATGETRSFSYRRSGACVAKVQPGAVPIESEDDAPNPVLGAPSAPLQATFTCKAGAPYALRPDASVCTGPSCAPAETGMCPEVESEATHAAGWRFYGGHNTETIVQEPNGQRISYRFDARGMPVEYTDETGQSTVYEYDAQRRLAQVIDPLGRKTQFRFDGWGNLLSMAGPLNRRTDYSYHPDHQQRTQTTQYLTGVSSVQGGQNLSFTTLVSSFAHDGAGNLTSIRDPLGHVANMRYGERGLISEITLFARVGTTSLPTVNNTVPGQIAASERTVSATYNAAGDLRSLSDALNQTIALDSDSLGRITRINDALSFQTRQQYNRNDQPTVTTDALDQESRLEYDSAGRLSAVFNAAGVALERYTYDGRSRLVRITDASNRDTTLEYDSANRLAAFTDRKGQRFAMSYDERGLVTRMTSPDRTIEATYDSIGRITDMRDASTTVAYRYDEADRVTEERTTTAAGQWSLGYQYDSVDRVTRRTLSGPVLAQPEVTDYTWDNAGRLTEQRTTLGPEGSQSVHITGYTFDAAGRLASRSSQITAAGVAEPSVTQRYYYDEADRLSRIEYLQNAGLPSEQLLERIDYTLDARGQRIAKTTLNNHGTGVNDTPMTATYDSANRMQSITLRPSADASTHRTYNLSYDANGNLIDKVNAANASERTTYTWDAQDKLIGLSKTGNGQTITASFQYDLFGRRVSSSIQVGTPSAQNPAQTVQYLYEGQQALGEIRSQRLSHRLITGMGLDETIARIAIAGSGAADTQASRQYLTDALNSVIAQSNAQGTGIANSYGYSPYGESITAGPDSTGNTAQYTSRENDGATGLYFYRARYYDPVLKRFISEDPIGLAGGDNVYGYVGGDPVHYTDPEGTIPLAPLAWAYARCVLQCTAKSAAMQAFNDGGIDCIDPLATAGDCALQCLNPLNWGGKAGARNLRAKGAANPKVKDAAARGREAHREFAERVKQKPGWKSEPTITGPNGEKLRPDALTPSGRPVELKPDTPSGRRQGERQIEKYKEATGKNGRVIYYKP
jgi:RHS repeat-associated protein